MMAHFMGNDISLRKVTRSAKALAEFIKEAKVNIDLTVAWALEWPDGRAGLAASRADCASEED